MCPRECGADRASGRTGYCRTGRNARVASCHPHFGEETPLVGRHGSGTIFFSSCSLLCSFCQNYDISRLNGGVDVTPPELAAAMIGLQDRGCHNINLVTPTHVVPQILEALVIAADRGLNLPLVYNSGGYDSVETVRLLDGVVDIYMPDFKFWDRAPAERYCHAPDYRAVAIAAIREMHRQVGDLQIARDGIATRGLLVRHLVMPNNLAGTAEVMRFIAEEISPETYVNVMGQYHPCGQADGDPAINHAISRSEFSAALEATRRAGLHRLDR
jgi:putative pyruvate formate lyase activating enzyme